MPAPLNMFRAILGVILGACLLAACSAAPARNPDTHYDLEVSLPAIDFGTSATVEIRRVDIRGLQSGRSLVIMTGDNPARFREERGHFWHVATPTLVERAFTTSINDAQDELYFGNSDAVRGADYRMVLTVTRFAYAPGGEAMVNFDATVKSAKGDVVLARSYWGRAPLEAETPAAGVTAIGEALSEAILVFAGELKAAL